MATITAVESITLDGVMQAPGAPDEDTRGGFAHGGWAVPYNDEVQAREMGRGMAREGGMLLGRRTYEILMRAWAGRDDNPFTPVLEARRKYVVSNSLSEPLPWVNSTLLRAGLVDELTLLVHPLVLGSGTRLFGDDGARAPLSLAGSVATTTGVVIGTYRLAGA